MKKSGLAHCCHHDKHYEYCYDYDKRVRFIKKYKPLDEQELRLKLFQIIPYDRLPGKNSAEWEAYHKAGEAYHKAWEAYHKAREAYLAKYKCELDKLHAELFPDCPWDGKAILKGEREL